MGCSSLSKYSNSKSFSIATSFFHVFTPFFLCFWPVYTRSIVCQNTVEGLSTLVQGSIEAVQGRFCTFPIKICLLIASLHSDWSNTPEKFFYNTIFGVVSGNCHCHSQFSNALMHCASCAMHGPYAEDLKGDSTRIEEKARHKKLQQRLGDLASYAVLPLVSLTLSTYGQRCVW